MQINAVYNRVFEGLKSAGKDSKSCLVEVEQGSVVVYPMHDRLAAIRRKSWRSGCIYGFFSGFFLSAIAAAFYLLSGSVEWKSRLASYFQVGSVLSRASGRPVDRPSSNPSEKAGIAADNKSPERDLRNEESFLTQSRDALLLLAETERLLYVGTYDRYTQVLGIEQRVPQSDQIFVIRSRKLRAGKYLVLVLPESGGQDFEAARERVSRQLGLPLLKWNIAKRYRTLLD